MKINYKLLNSILGWACFVIASIVYILTIEPTASFWDCGEFIASAYKLEVGHPPGAPFFMMVANFFTHFSSDVTTVAKMVNIFSALCSSATILLLFWTITHMMRKLIGKEAEELSLPQQIAILGSGVVGALAYTFSDTFWFSAVEGEVYACSSFFTALVFWLILKWEDRANQPHSDKWLVLIAYCMGLSIGVHLLNLLAIPAIVLVYYYKKYQPDWKGTSIAIFVSFLIIIFLMYGFIPGTVRVAGWFELLFVNTLSLPYNSGVYAYCIVLIAAILWGIYETAKGASRIRAIISFTLAIILLGIPFLGLKPIIGVFVAILLFVILFLRKKLNYRVLNTTLAVMMVMAIGYSSFAWIMIRSSANTPLDLNSPRDIFSLQGYLNREQYGDRPLIYGETFVSEEKWDPKTGLILKKDGAPIYNRKVKKDPSEKDEYVITGHKKTYIFHENLNMLFTRMYSQEAYHIEAYKDWSDFKGKPVTINNGGNTKTVIKPTFTENLRFFFRYQVGFMYFRYFMWNFSGRQNDIQGHGDFENGNFITGFNFIDKYLVGDQSNLPDELANNKGRNVFYLMPLLLGLIGLLYQLSQGKKGKQSFFITFMLFFMTGIAIVMYLNQKPFEPRERDYAYAGSFYAFCIWIGMGTYALYKLLSKYTPQKTSAIIAAVLTLIVPIQMASQTWDDHDRSGRTVCPDFAYNYLMSCEKDAILFTMGDNDTYPLWYLQEVEGIRTDVRVCNVTFLTTAWYIDQMKRQAYESDPLPISWTRPEYFRVNEGIPIYNRVKNQIDVRGVLDVVKSENKLTMLETAEGLRDYIPASKFFLSIDSAAVVRNGVVKPEEAGKIVPAMEYDFSNRNWMKKGELMILDMLVQNNWKRPMYFATTVSPDEHLNMQRYFRQTGMAYQITPLDQPLDVIDTERMYNNIMNHFRFGGADKPGIYLDDKVRSMAQTIRFYMHKLADSLIKEGKKEKAKNILDLCIEKLPHENLPYNHRSLPIIEAYFRIGEKEKAEQVAEQILEGAIQKGRWYSGLNTRFRNQSADQQHLQVLVCKEIFNLYQTYAPDIFEKNKGRLLSEPWMMIRY